MMIKCLILTFLAVSCHGTVIKLPGTDQVALIDPLTHNDKALHWSSHLLDFLNLVEVEKVLGVAVQYMYDPEVMNVLGFILGPDFKAIMWELESMEEFDEIYLFLSSKGYDIKNIFDFINSVLELPPYIKPGNLRSLPPKKGMSGFIVDMLGALPLEEMKNLFKTKLENDPEVAEFMATLDSPELMLILKKMAKNPKIDDFKSVFESYGIDFKFICSVMEELIGDLNNGIIFCHK